MHPHSSIRASNGYLIGGAKGFVAAAGIIEDEEDRIMTRLARCALLLAMVTAVAVVGAMASFGAGASYVTHLRGAVDLLARDLPRQAADEFAAANADDYVDPLGWVGIGAARLAQGHIEAALAAFERATEFAAAGSEQARTVAPVARFGRAVCGLQRGQAEAARDELAELEREGFAWTLPALAYADLAVGDKSAARDRADAALVHFPHDPLALAVLGRALASSQGIAHLREALEACPGAPYAAPLTGLALPNRAQPAATRELVRVEVSNGAQRRAVVTWLGDARPDYFLLKIDGVPAGMSNAPPHEFGLPRDLGPGPHGLVVEAWADNAVLGRGAVVLPAGSPGTPANRYDGGEYAAAAEALRAALAPMPNRVHLHYWLAAAYAVQGNRAMALRHYECVVALDPSVADARQRLVALCAALGVKGSTKVITSGPDKRVYLTFDDGPHPMYTERILGVLRKAGVRATFFVVGTQARAHPDLLRAIAAQGHDIADHSYSHDDMTTKSAAQVQQELLRTAVIVADVTGKRPRLFRPPGGKHNAGVRAAAAQVGFTTVMWSADVGVCAGLSPERGLAQLLSDIKPGGIVLLHNGPDETIDILPGLLAALKKRGYSFGTLSEVTERKPPRR